MGELSILNKPKNEDLIEKYLSYFKHSEQSMATRKSAINYFIKRFGYKGNLLDIEKKNLIDYFNYLNQSDELVLSSKKLKWTILKNLVGFCNDYYEDVMEKAIILPKFTIKWKLVHKKSDSNKDVIATETELKQILDCFEITSNRNYLIFKIFVDTGMRIGELESIDYDKINTKKRIIETKGKAGLKAYYITKKTNDVLKYFINNRKELSLDTKALFLSSHLKRMSKRNIQKILHQALNHLKIKKDITAHTFRRTINTYRKKMGCDLEDRKILLNQKVNDVNFESYTKLKYEDFIELYDKWYPYNF
ncbi:Tyrosine recombinase XerC [subsurface metagenome]